MHQCCIKYAVMVFRVVVAQILKHLNSVGANTKMRGTLRHCLYYSKGPNWVGHNDGSEKLKHFGFETHSHHIDGYVMHV